MPQANGVVFISRLGITSMLYKQTTQVPNFVLDNLTPQLTEAELKILLVVIRQTFGWFNKKTGKRKERDRINHYLFQKKSGLSRRSVIKAIQGLTNKSIIASTDFKGNALPDSHARMGKNYIYYSLNLPVQKSSVSGAQKNIAPVRKRTHNKTNYQKITLTKLNTGFNHVADILPKVYHSTRSCETKDI